MQITRRNALVGAGAVMAVAGVPGAVQGDDAVLLARLRQFPDLYDRWTRLWQKAHAHRTTVEAMPECPNYSNYRARDAFLKAHDYLRYWDEANRLGEPLGVLVNAIFETPAETIEGVLGKVRILYIARGDYDGDGNDNLEGFQDEENCPWFGAVIADFERRLWGLRP